MSTPGAFRLFDLLLNPPPPTPCWIGSKILPQSSVCLFGGNPKVGKTFMMLSFVESLITGMPLFAHDGFPVERPARVLLIDRELGREGLYDRTSAMFSPYLQMPEMLHKIKDSFWCISRDQRVSISSAAGLDLIRSALDESGANILLLDPIGKMHHWDENSAGDMNLLFETLEDFRNKYLDRGLSVVLSHHFIKGPSSVKERGDPLDPRNFRGSGRWWADPDTIITVAKQRDHFDREWDWWELVVRIELRAGRPIRDFHLSVNENNDGRVLFQKFKDQ